MPFTDRRGHRIHYRTQGPPNAPPLLLVMGMGLSSEAWDTLPSRLAERHLVITFDNRGTGQSALPRRPYTMRTLADDAAAVLDAVGAARADVFGISMGGMISQELVLRHPEKVRRLALGCTFASWARSKKPHPRVLLDLLSVLRHRADLSQLARLLVGDGFLDRPGAREAFVRWRQAADRGRARRAVLQVIAVGLHGTTRRLRRVAVPTLVMTGDADRLVRIENAQALTRAIPGARLHVFPGVGHVFPVEREEEMVALLEEHFLGPAGETRAAG
jgi:3-oxoadipate enol-lactonase